MRRAYTAALVAATLVITVATPALAAEGWVPYRDHFVHWHTTAPPAAQPESLAWLHYVQARAHAVLVAQRENDRYRAELQRAAAAAARARAAAASAPPSGGTYTGSVAALIVQQFGRYAPGWVNVGLCVASIESHFQPGADNPTSSAAGVFQFVSGTWAVLSARYGFGGASVYDAFANVTVAAHTFGDGGSGNWSGDGPACGF